MQRNDSCTSSVALVSFIAGTVIGAGIALLVAPRSGAETRQILKEYGQDLTDKSGRIPGNLKESAEKAIERGREMVGEGKKMIHQGTDMIHQGKEYLDEKKRALSAAIEAGKEAMEHEREKLASISDD